MGKISNCKISIISNFILVFSTILFGISTCHYYKKSLELEESIMATITWEIKIHEDSRKINDEYETRAQIKISNQGRTGVKDFNFRIELAPLVKIQSFEVPNYPVEEKEGKRKENSRTYITTNFLGKSTIEGTLIFISLNKYKKGWNTHPIKIIVPGGGK